MFAPGPALARDLKGGALAFRRPTAVMRRGPYPRTRLRAALPGITGSKREDPLRHQCSQHLAVRSRAGRSMPKTARIRLQAPSGNRARPIDRLSPVDVPSMGEPALCSCNGDRCQDSVSTPATTAFDLMSLHAPSLVAVCQRRGRRGRTGRRIDVAGAAIAAGYACLALLRRAVVGNPNKCRRQIS